MNKDRSVIEMLIEQVEGSKSGYEIEVHGKEAVAYKEDEFLKVFSSIGLYDTSNDEKFKDMIAELKGRGFKKTTYGDYEAYGL